jgi:hypothetical protein
MIWRLSISLPVSMLINSIVVAMLNQFLNLGMSPIDVVGWAIISTLIGNTLAELIRYAIKLAKEHKV